MNIFIERYLSISLFPYGNYKSEIIYSIYIFFLSILLNIEQTGALSLVSCSQRTEGLGKASAVENLKQPHFM